MIEWVKMTKRIGNVHCRCSFCQQSTSHGERDLWGQLSTKYNNRNKGIAEIHIHSSSLKQINKNNSNNSSSRSLPFDSDSYL